MERLVVNIESINDSHSFLNEESKNEIDTVMNNAEVKDFRQVVGETKT